MNLIRLFLWYVQELAQGLGGPLDCAAFGGVSRWHSCFFELRVRLHPVVSQFRSLPAVPPTGSLDGMCPVAA